MQVFSQKLTSTSTFHFQITSTNTLKLYLSTITKYKYLYSPHPCCEVHLLHFYFLFPIDTREGFSYLFWPNRLVRYLDSWETQKCWWWFFQKFYTCTYFNLRFQQTTVFSRFERILDNLEVNLVYKNIQK